MSYKQLQQNLQKLLDSNEYEIGELENKARLKKNSVYNILKGLSKKPSGEALQAIADVFDISVKDLLTTLPNNNFSLSKEDYQLISKVTQELANELTTQNKEVGLTEFFKVLKEIFNYSKESSASEPDIKFTKWVIKQRF